MDEVKESPPKLGYWSEWIRRNPEKRDAYNARKKRRRRELGLLKSRPTDEARALRKVALKVENKEKINAYHREWREKNKQKARAASVKWRSLNREYFTSRQAARRAMKLCATPPWVDMQIIELIYAEAQHRGLEVDHIIPLQNALVCGLHVHTNMQLLSRAENVRKLNRFNPITE